MDTPTLTTDRLRLRPVADDDRGALYALQSDAHVLRYWDDPPWTDPARAAQFVEACRRMADEGSGVRLAIERPADGTFIGWCALSGYDSVHRSARLTVCLAEASWGQGYAVEALAALLDWAFDTLDLNRVQAEADTRNTACGRVLDRLGFTREGTLREDCVVDGVVSDSWVFGLLRGDRTPSATTSHPQEPTPFTDKPTLVGSLVTLRPIRAEDADTLDRIIREDDEIAVLTGSVHDSTAPAVNPPLEELRAIYGRWAVADDRLVLAVVDNADGSLVGEVVLNDWDPGNRSCGFRTFVGAAGRGRGLGTEATRLVVEHGLGPMGLHRIQLEVYDINPRARRVYEKVGFVHEGTGREALLLDGRWVDVHHMAVLAP